ncbi:hypothetical protein [Salinigranum rubrum]|nr:hypothetical protein [Salinigranum rubrum]
MFDRRTRARLVFLAEFLAFPFKLSQLRRATDEDARFRSRRGGSSRAP